MSKLLEIWDRWSTTGIKMPFLHDPETGKPSETLLFYKATTTITICSLLALHFKVITPGTTFTTAVVNLLAFVCYRMRKLDKVKLDLDDQSIELDSDDNNDDKQEKEKE